MTKLFDHLKAALADRYLLERELGSGGMATVFLAHDPRHNRKVAIKVMRSEIAAALERSPSEVLFVSDIGAELDAARAAGMRTALCMRTPGSAPSPSAHPVISTFDGVAVGQ